MPDMVTVVTPAGAERQVNPSEAAVGDLTVMRPGDRVALDGVLESDYDVDFDTSAITGESVPRNVAPGGEVLAGYIPLDREARVRVTHAYADSSMSRIMRMIEDAASRKSEPETLLRRITRWYTPAVMVRPRFCSPFLGRLVCSTAGLPSTGGCGSNAASCCWCARVPVRSS